MVLPRRMMGENRWADFVCLLYAVCILAAFHSPSIANDAFIVVVGNAGAPEFEQPFADAAKQWQQLAKRNQFPLTLIGGYANRSDDPSERLPDRDLLKQAFIDSQQRRNDSSNGSSETLWLILIGHGTFADGIAKFNLRGADFSASELAEWMSKISGPVIVINGSSSSGPFVNRLSGQNRVVVTGTRSGAEQNYTRFGEYFATAISSPDADLDHDDEVSVMEAFVAASRKVKRFYESEGRLSTEHALLDDNGDAAGTPAQWFLKNITANSNSDVPDGVDGARAKRFSISPTGQRIQFQPEQILQRDELERQLETLRARRGEFSEPQYLEKIEPILVNLARLYQTADRAAPKESDEPVEPKTESSKPNDERSDGPQE